MITNQTEHVKIIKNADFDIIGYILPGESCLLSKEYLRSQKISIPKENNDNVIVIK